MCPLLRFYGACLDGGLRFLWGFEPRPMAIR